MPWPVPHRPAAKQFLRPLFFASRRGLAVALGRRSSATPSPQARPLWPRMRAGGLRRGQCALEWGSSGAEEGISGAGWVTCRITQCPAHADWSPIPACRRRCGVLRERCHRQRAGQRLLRPSRPADVGLPRSSGLAQRAGHPRPAIAGAGQARAPPHSIRQASGGVAGSAVPRPGTSAAISAGRHPQARWADRLPAAQ
jgi:hypothetical protein